MKSFLLKVFSVFMFKLFSETISNILKHNKSDPVNFKQFLNRTKASFTSSIRPNQDSKVLSYRSTLNMECTMLIMFSCLINLCLINLVLFLQQERSLGLNVCSLIEVQHSTKRSFTSFCNQFSFCIHI